MLDAFDSSVLTEFQAHSRDVVGFVQDVLGQHGDAGGVQVSRRYEHSGSTSIGSIKGNVYIGDSGSLGGGADGSRDFGETGNPSSGVSFEAQRKKIAEVFAEVPGFDRASSILAEHGLVYLCGKPGCGRHAAAIRALDLAGVDQIRLFGRGRLNDAAASRHLAPRTGYLFDAPLFDDDGDESAWVEQLAADLRAARSCLVVIGVPDRDVGWPSLDPYRVDLREAPHAPTLLKRHLAYYGDGDSSWAERLLDDPRIAAYLERKPSPAVLDRLALALSHKVISSEQIGQVLARFETMEQGDVRAIFRRQSDLDGRCLLLTLAVLSGARESSILDGEEYWRSSLKPAKPADRDSDSDNDPFGAPRDAILSAAEAEVAEVEQPGGVAVRRVRLQNPQRQPALLRFFWTEYPMLRPAIVDWLSVLSRDRSAETRGLAALAAARLGQYDYDNVLRDLLIPWANSGIERVQYTCARAIGVVATDDSLARPMFRELRDWARKGDNWRLSWTAAAAYGGVAGRRLPQEAVTELLSILRRPSRDVVRVAICALVSLFHNPDDDTRGQLTAVAESVAGERDRVVRLTALTAFLAVAAHAKSGVGADRPTLLDEVHSDSQAPSSLARLWQASFNEKALRKVALVGLRGWVVLGDREDSLRDDLLSLVRELHEFGTVRERRRLEFYLNRWGNDGVTFARKAIAVLPRTPSDL